jgi:hypothetical protein
MKIIFNVNSFLLNLSSTFLLLLKAFKRAEIQNNFPSFLLRWDIIRWAIKNERETLDGETKASLVKNFFVLSGYIYFFSDFFKTSCNSEKSLAIIMKAFKHRKKE